MSYLKIALANNLAHFEALIAGGISAETLRTLDARCRRLYRVLDKGLAHPELATRTAQLIIQLITFIDYTSYRKDWALLLERAYQTTNLETDLFCRLSNKLADLLIRVKELDKAKRIVNNLSTLPCDAYNRATITLRRAQIVMEDRDYAATERLLNEAIAIFSRLNHSAPEQLGKTYLIFCELYRRTGQASDLRDTGHKAVATFEQTKSDLYLGVAWEYVCMAERELGNYRRSLEAVNNAIHLFEQTDNNMRLQWALNGRAVLHCDLGDWAAAEATMRQINLSRIEERGEWELQAMIQHNYGEILCLSHRHDEAIEMLRQAAALWLTHEKFSRQAVAESYLAEALICTGQTEEGAALWISTQQRLPHFPKDPETTRRLAYIEENLQSKMLALIAQSRQKKDTCFAQVDL